MKRLVIEIPDEVYNYIKDRGYVPPHVNIAPEIANGTVLPKGHGRLVDENHVIAELVYRKNLLAGNVKCGEVTEIFNSAVVIDADKGSNREVISDDTSEVN